MAFNRPSDIAAILGIFALVVITAGYLLNSVTAGTENQLVSTTRANVLGVEGLQGTAGNMTTGLQRPTGQDVNTENIEVSALDSILGLGRTVTGAINTTETAAAAAYVPNEFVRIVVAVLVITFAVIVFSWFKGATI